MKNGNTHELILIPNSTYKFANNNNNSKNFNKIFISINCINKLKSQSQFIFVRFNHHEMN